MLAGYELGHSVPKRQHERPAKCASAQVDQSLYCPPEDALDTLFPAGCPAKTDLPARMHKLI